MPWPDPRLSREAIRGLPAIAIRETKMMQLALEFYAVHQASDEPDIIAYHPDTQGIFSLAHLLNGNLTFLEVLDGPAWTNELLKLVLEFNSRAVKVFKSRLDEGMGSMIDGHGTPQAVYFPNAGVRISGDASTLVSPKVLDEYALCRHLSLNRLRQRANEGKEARPGS